MCPALAAWDLVAHSIEIGQPAGQPILAMKNSKGTNTYLTSSRIATLLKRAVRVKHPDMSKDEISRFTCHSFWVMRIAK